MQFLEYDSESDPEDASESHPISSSETPSNVGTVESSTGQLQAPRPMVVQSIWTSVGDSDSDSSDGDSDYESGDKDKRNKRNRDTATASHDSAASTLPSAEELLSSMQNPPKFLTTFSEGFVIAPKNNLLREDAAKGASASEETSVRGPHHKRGSSAAPGEAVASVSATDAARLKLGSEPIINPSGGKQTATASNLRETAKVCSFKLILLCYWFTVVLPLLLMFVSVKDRVKRQRVSGQSGIGADFRTWKSEEEMRQRQLYD